MPDVVLKSLVAQSTFDHVKSKYGDEVWEAILGRLDQDTRIAVTAGGNVPLSSMGWFNQAFVAEVCGGSTRVAEREFRAMGAASAEKLLTGGGIFSVFTRFITPKAILSRAEGVIKTAYPGVVVSTVVNEDASGGVIEMKGMSGYPYGSQRVVGWLLRGLEIVGATNAAVSERKYAAGEIDTETYVFDLSWQAGE